jgi:RNA polymerase sigma-70 factor (ECF subfamily)
MEQYKGYSSDEELIEAITSPYTREIAFKALLDNLHKPIYFHLRRLMGNHEDAADATQNTFIQVFTSISSFKFNSKLSTWIFTIATRKGLDLLKKRKQTTSIDEAMLSLSFDTYFDSDDLSTKLQAAVLTLPPKQRAVFTLKYFEGLDYTSISLATGTSVGALKASYFHANKKIKPYLINSVI